MHENAKAFTQLTLSLKSQAGKIRAELSWELVLLAGLAVTIFGLYFCGPVSSFPKIASQTPVHSLENDPYDIQPDHNYSGGFHRVVIGL
jgi:hypothetical protein